MDGLASEDVPEAIFLSIGTAGFSTLLAILMGTPLAYVLPRLRGRTRRFLESLIDLPVSLPPAVAGIALLLAFGRKGLLGTPLRALGIELAFTPVAVILAQLFVAGPHYIKAAALGFASIDAELKEAAALDGASALAAFWAVDIPLAGRAMVSGAITCLARALGEFGATIIFAGNFPGKTQTMPLAIYIGFQMDLNLAVALSVLLVAASFLGMLGARSLIKPKEY